MSKCLLLVVGHSHEQIKNLKHALPKTKSLEFLTNYYIFFNHVLYYSKFACYGNARYSDTSIIHTVRSLMMVPAWFLLPLMEI